MIQDLGLDNQIRQADVVKWQAEKFGVNEKTIKRNITVMVGTGLIRKSQDPISRKHVLLSLDPGKGSRIINHKGFWFRGDLKLLGET